MIGLTRFIQVLKYGLKHAKDISKKCEHKKTFVLYMDILYCYFKYGMWSNQYALNQFYNLDNLSRKKIGESIKKSNAYREKWVNGYFSEQKFLAKYADIKYDTTLAKRRKKINAYTKRFNLGKGALVEYNVCITKQHFSDSTMSAGDGILLSRNVDIDYTGNLRIGNNVKMTEGVKILTHSHDAFGLVDEDDLLPFSNRAYKTSLSIGDNVKIYAHAIILPSVSVIGNNSIISSGSVVTQDVPDNCVVAGNPAKVVAKVPKSGLLM